MCPTMNYVPEKKPDYGTSSGYHTLGLPCSVAQLSLCLYSFVVAQEELRDFPIQRNLSWNSQLRFAVRDLIVNCAMKLPSPSRTSGISNETVCQKFWETLCKYPRVHLYYTFYIIRCRIDLPCILTYILISAWSFLDISWREARKLHVMLAICYMNLTVRIKK